MIWLLVKYIMAAAMRDKILISFLVFIGVAISLSIFLGSAAVTEKDQFSLVFTASALRLGGMLTLVLFVVFFIRKSFETRDVEYMLTRPISRIQFLGSYFLSFLLLTFIISALSLFVIFVLPTPVNFEGAMIWGLSIFIELSLIVMVATFFAFVLNSAVTATLMVLAFYALSRMIGGILGIVETGYSSSGATPMMLIEKLMVVISVVIPRFDLMGQSSWLIYGPQENIDWSFLLSQGFVFGGLVFFAALLDFKRKQF